MGLFRDTERHIANITSGAEADQSFAEEQDKRDAVIRQVLAEAALKNEMTEAGRLFGVRVLGENPYIDEIDLRTQGTSEALALGRDNDTILFQATSTSALAQYIDVGSIIREQDDTSSMAAD